MPIVYFSRPGAAYCFELSEECFLFCLFFFFLGFKAAAKFVTVPSHHTKPGIYKQKSLFCLLPSLSHSLIHVRLFSLSLSHARTALLYNNKPRLKPLVCWARLINPWIQCSCFVSEAYFVESWNLSTTECFYRIYCRYLVYLMLYEYLW